MKGLGDSVRRGGREKALYSLDLLVTGLSLLRLWGEGFIYSQFESHRSVPMYGKT
jgi:hypothetical protein